MQVRVIKNIGTYQRDQRLRMDTFHAQQLIAAGIAVPDESLPSAEDEHAASKAKRRYRRRDLTANSE